jgi:hypothetical protein
VPRLIGAVIRRHSFVSLYNTALWSHLALNITAGAYFIYTLFHKVGDDDLNNCIASYVGDLISQYTCAQEFEIYRRVIITIYVVICLFELCASSSLPLSLHLPPILHHGVRPNLFTYKVNRYLSRRRRLCHAASGRGGAGLSAPHPDGCYRTGATVDGDYI